MSHAERARTPDFLKTHEFGGTIGIEFDKEAMPKFDTTNGYAEKNKWYFLSALPGARAHGGDVQEVARALAAKVNANNEYQASVKKNADGSATITVDWM